MITKIGPGGRLLAVLIAAALLALVVYLAAGRPPPEGGQADLAQRIAVLAWRGLLLEGGGRAALAAGDPAAALEHFSAAPVYAPLSAAGSLALGDALRMQGDWPAAIAAWQAARALGSDPAAAAYRLLDAHRTLRDYPAAIADLRELNRLEPGNASHHYQLGLLLAAREPDLALTALLEAAELDEGLRDAVRLLEQGLAPDPQIDDPAYLYFNAGRALASLSEWDLAAEAFRQAVIANPGYAEAWAFLGQAFDQLGADGTEMFQTALDLQPESLAANLLYALHLRRQGSPSAALPYLERAERAAPDAPAVAAAIAQTYADLGDVNRALEFFLRAVDLAPDDPSYLHLLAMYSIYNEIQVEEIGLPAARNAVLQDQEDPVALDLIGYVYYVRGDWVSGLRFLHRALDANPAYAPARLHLGMLLAARGDLDPARQQLELAVRLAPGSQAAVQAQEILARYFPP